MNKNVVKKVIRKLWQIIRMPEMQILPGQLAFFFVLSVIPMIALLGYLGIYCSLSPDQVETFVMNTFPKGTADSLLPILMGKTFSLDMFFFLATSFLLASNGAYSIIVVSNHLYKVEGATILKGRIKSILMTFVIVILIIFTLLVPTLGSLILDNIGKIDTLGPAMNEITYGFNLIKWPISLIFIYANIKLIYTMAPDIKIKSRGVTRGAIFTTVLWIMAAKVYSSYLSAFTHYDIFYGSISNLIILLLWVYLLSYIFVMGLTINTFSVVNKVEAK